MGMRPVGRVPPGRSEWRRIADWDPPPGGAYMLTRENGRPLAGKAASNGSATPGPATPGPVKPGPVKPGPVKPGPVKPGRLEQRRPRSPCS